jgi:hypothetical protein
MPVLQRLLEEQRQLFANDSAAAQKVLKVGESRSDSSLNAINLAATTVLANALLNHDAAVMRR